MSDNEQRCSRCGRVIMRDVPGSDAWCEGPVARLWCLECQKAARKEAAEHWQRVSELLQKSREERRAAEEAKPEWWRIDDEVLELTVILLFCIVAFLVAFFVIFWLLTNMLTLVAILQVAILGGGLYYARKIIRLIKSID